MASEVVGPNDPQKGRSKIGGFGVPGSKPVKVRNMDEVHSVLWGGFRKPKAKGYDDLSPRLAGGGYTSSQTSNERGRLTWLLLGAPVLLLALVGFIGWFFYGRLPEPITSTCSNDGYTATYAREDFHRDATHVDVLVEFTYPNARPGWVQLDVPLTSPEFTISVPAGDAGSVPGLSVASCEVTRMEPESLFQGR